METKLKKLPTGIQTFEKIREGDYIYVDKTRFLVDLIDTGTVYFLARPRRFGKSLTISTFDALFSGKKELFKGLYAEEFMTRPDYHASPVIRLDMSDTTTDEGVKAFLNSVKTLVHDQADIHDITLDPQKTAGELLSSLIKEIYRKNGEQKVVVLIDEYDKPYSEFYNEPKMAEKIRKALRNFYVRVKANDKYIRFVFITGIAKFAKFGVFSTLNNIVDISMSKDYGEMCGLTETEIEQYFPEHIAATAKEMNILPKELLEKMRHFYDGFCFDGIHRLYNPFSTLYFFREKEFNNYWMEAGTSELIAKYLKNKKLTVEQFHNFPVSKNFLRTPGYMDSTPPEGFLYQGGFLTIREGTVNDFMLDYPNTEVLNAMSMLMAQNILSDDNRYSNYQNMMLMSLTINSIDKFIEAINALLASIPYDDFAGAGEMNIMVNDYRFKAQEWLYRSTILAFMRGCGVATVAEMHTNLGRADFVISHRGNTYVIELKVAYEPENIPAKLAEAVEQMKSKNYLAPYPDAKGLAIVIDDTKRLIGNDCYKVVK